MSARWSSEQIPDQHGRTAIVTGANSGLGLVTARELARHGASVVLACRNTVKGESALREIEAAVPDARVELAALDLSSLDSVRAFAERYRSDHDGLDLLINNAGIGAGGSGARRQVNAAGVELRFAVNYLAGFALTLRLLPLIRRSAPARIVNVASVGQRAIDFDDVMLEHG